MGEADGLPRIIKNIRIMRSLGMGGGWLKPGDEA